MTGERRFFGTPWRHAATTGIVTALLALFWWLAVSASIEHSHTSDELPHIAAGYIFDRYGDFRAHPENGALPQRLFGLPPLFDHARLESPELFWRYSAYWQVAWDFFYANNNLTDWIVLRARAINALFGVGLGLMIFLVARTAFGRAGGILALALFVLAPNFLAHAALATSDMAATLFLTLAPWTFWWHLRRRDLPSGVLAAAASGLTLVAKFNGLLLAPIYVGLIAADIWIRGGGARRRRLAADIGFVVLQAAGALLIVWWFFGFRFDARGDGTPEIAAFAWDWSDMFSRIGWKAPLISLALDLHLLPQAWLYGLTNVLAGAASRPAFFAGHYSLHGWWYFFPTLFAAKTPLALLAAFALGIARTGVLLRRSAPAERRHIVESLLPLIVSAAVIGSTAVGSDLDIGDRHILGIYPVLFVLCGAIAGWHIVRWTAPLLACGLAIESFAIRPHYLSFFNAAAGGPRAGYRWFADSTLDWGQDLPALHAWLAAHRRPGEKLYLGYFGSAWPPHYGVRPDYFLPSMTYVVRPPLTRYELEPGLYCVSVTFLHEVYSRFAGPWTTENERRYRTARDAIDHTPAGGGLPPEYENYDAARCARLLKFLQTRAPDAYAGYSILIFRLSRAEIAAALDGPAGGLHAGQP